MMRERRSAQEANGLNAKLSARTTRQPLLGCLVLCAVVQLITPSPAHAWFAWLDHLSGPGPFWGAEFDLRIVCLMEQPPVYGAIVHIQTADALIQALPGLKQTDKDAFKTNLRTINDDIRNMIADPAQRRNALGSAEQLSTQIDSLNRLIAQAVPVSGTEPAPRDSPVVLPQLPPSLAEIRTAITRAQDSLRAAAVPKRALWPGGLFWASCSDSSPDEPNQEQLRNKIRHADRHPQLSLGFTYREYTNWKLTPNPFSWGQPGNSQYANGETIHMQVFSSQVSWPLSGHYDFLDGQTGFGVSRFYSRGMDNDHWALMLEPIRADFHFPASWADRLPVKKATRVVARIGLAVSYRLGIMMFPQGFPPETFNPARDVARQIPGNEALFQQGLVLNVGRIFGL